VNGIGFTELENISLSTTKQQQQQRLLRKTMRDSRLVRPQKGKKFFFDTKIMNENQ